MVGPKCFGITSPSSRSVPRAFSEVLTRHNTPIHSILSTTYLRISQKALGKILEDGNVMPKHVGATIHYL
jgi:hypothetical protein